MSPIPAQPPIGGTLWSVIVPAALLLFTFVATYLLYRHFAGRGAGERGDGAPPR